MSEAGPILETREVLLERARLSMTLAQAEPLPQRAQIHLAAARRWTELADRKLKRDRGEGVPPPGPTILPVALPPTYF
jgi:hypothetical protein